MSAPITPTWDSVCHVIRTGDDDLYSIAVALDQPVEELRDVLAEMTDKALLYRWSDGNVTRHGICGERRAA